MKWFKHFSTAMDDLFVKDLERKFGDTGYAFWFKTLELIAAHGQNGVLKISWKNYCDKLNKRRDHLRRILAFATQDEHLTFAENSEDSITITCSRFAEISDNFTIYGKPLQSDFKVTSKQEEDKKKKEKKKDNTNVVEQYSPDSPQVLLSKKLLDGIRLNDEKFKEPDIQKWGESIDLLLRLDERAPQEIEDVIDFVLNDSFWKNNILSTRKLREKFSQLFLRMKNGAGKHTNSTQTRAGFSHTEKDVERFRDLENTLRDHDRKRSERS